MRYDERNFREISLLHPAMKHKVLQLFDRLELIGEDVLIVTDGGKRSSEEQDQLYAQGRTQPGRIVTGVNDSNSYHTHGLAIDLAPVGPLGVPLHEKYLLEWASFGRYENIAREAQAVGLEWGFAMWKTDKPHFQYRQGLTIADLKRGKAPDVEQAKQERLSDLERQLEIATLALNRRAVKESRKKELRPFVNRLERTIERLRK